MEGRPRSLMQSHSKTSWMGPSGNFQLCKECLSSLSYGSCCDIEYIRATSVILCKPVGAIFHMNVSNSHFFSSQVIVQHEIYAHLNSLMFKLQVIYGYVSCNVHVHVHMWYVHFMYMYMYTYVHVHTCAITVIKTLEITVYCCLRKSQWRLSKSKLHTM